MVNDAVKANDCLAHIARCLPALIVLVASMLNCGETRAQESAGQAEVAMQGYYMSGSQQPLLETSGMAENSTQFLRRAWPAYHECRGIRRQRFSHRQPLRGTAGDAHLGLALGLYRRRLPFLFVPGGKPLLQRLHARNRRARRCKSP